MPDEHSLMGQLTEKLESVAKSMGRMEDRLNLLTYGDEREGTIGIIVRLDRLERRSEFWGNALPNLIAFAALIASVIAVFKSR